MCFCGTSFRCAVRYGFDWTVSPVVIDTYTTQPAQTTLSGTGNATHSQQEPWWPVLGSRPPEFLPGQVPETGSRITSASDRTCENFSNEFQTFDQIHVVGTGPVRVRKLQLSLINTMLIQIANQDPRRRFTTHQRPYSSAEYQFAFHPEKQYPPP